VTDTFGKYEVVRQLASGGFGAIFEAEKFDPIPAPSAGSDIPARRCVPRATFTAAVALLANGSPVAHVARGR
jgi:hypothetical protein